MTAAIAIGWYLGTCAALVGLCMLLSAGDTWLDYLTSRRRMRRQLAAIHHDTQTRHAKPALPRQIEETDPS